MTNRIMKSSVVALALMTFAAAGTASAQTANQTVTFAVSAINQIAFTGSPSLTISSATAGSNPASATDASATWAVTTNQTGAKVSASIDSDMPTGLTLSVNLAQPSGGTSAGAKALSSTSVDLVTGVSKVAATGLGVTYTLDYKMTLDSLTPSFSAGAPAATVG